jgi:hypothetical protein
MPPARNLLGAHSHALVTVWHICDRDQGPDNRQRTMNCADHVVCSHGHGQISGGAPHRRPQVVSRFLHCELNNAHHGCLSCIREVLVNPIASQLWCIIKLFADGYTSVSALLADAVYLSAMLDVYPSQDRVNVGCNVGYPTGWATGEQLKSFFTEMYINICAGLN